jgi:hypothetical protein
MWWEPDMLHAEIDIRTPEDPPLLARIARRWLEAGLRALAVDQVQALLDAPPLTTRSLSRHRGAYGEPGTPWGTLAVTPDNRRHQISVHAWTPVTWERFLAAAGTNFRELSVELSELSEHGTDGGAELVKLTVRRNHPGYQGWTRLEALLTPRPADDARWEQTAQQWATFLTQQAEQLEVPPAGGFLADDTGGDFRTPFEHAVDLVPEEVLGTDLLRGYSWVTLLQAGALTRLGGEEAVRASGAFTDVRPLPAGGYVVRATNRLADYDDAAVRRVFEAVAAALWPGLPRRPELEREARLVYQDATDVTSR